jgi:hypothetical protein
MLGIFHMTILSSRSDLLPERAELTWLVAHVTFQAPLRTTEGDVVGNAAATSA